jgi:hypothetical protein
MSQPVIESNADVSPPRNVLATVPRRKLTIPTAPGAPAAPWGRGADPRRVLFAVALPYLGVFVYLVSRGQSMQDRRVKQQRELEDATDSRIRGVASAPLPCEHPRVRRSGSRRQPRGA